MNRRRLRVFLLMGACAALVCISLFFAWKEKRAFMGVEIMSERAHDALPAYAYADIGEYLTQNGQSAALDREESVLYVSLDAGAHDDIRQMPVALALHHPGYRLYFAPGAAFDDFDQAVQDGHRFALIAAARDHHMRYEVVFTRLPVIRLNTQSGSDESEHEGSVCLWADYPADEGYYSVAASRARWHKRGGISRSAAKVSYKLTLEKPSGAKNSVSMLDMGSDDDWILNAMPKDDLKLREMTITTLWNEHQKTTGYQIPMSPCRYVEAVIDGRYMGLYLLQRRMDNKLLGERYAKDVLYKGDMNIDQRPVEGVFQIRSNPRQVSHEELYEYIRPFFHLMKTRDAQYDTLRMDEENWLDLNVFCSVFAMADNFTSKNIYLIRHEQNGEYVLQFALWDTDMSMGLGWRNDDVFYDAQNIKSKIYLRQEAQARFSGDAKLYDAYLSRYTQLRSSLLSDDSILKTVLACSNEITESGALQRDQQRWGLHNGGEDTLGKLIEFIQSRAAWLDETYLKSE